jgi:hypothetical protein
MKTSLMIAPLAALLALAGCGRDKGAGGLTAEEDRQLDNAAAMLNEGVFDVSADSLVANEAQILAEENAAAGPPAAPARQAGAAPANQAAANQAGTTR